MSSPDEADAVMLAFLHHEEPEHGVLFAGDTSTETLEAEIAAIEAALGVRGGQDVGAVGV